MTTTHRDGAWAESALFTAPGGTIEVVRGGITDAVVDVIVNAANSSLMGGGGVDGAIHRAAGPALLNACRAVRARQGRCDTGDAVITTAGNLHAAHVVHTVGPVWRGGQSGEDDLLAQCYTRSLALARDAGARSIAFPAISTGVYRFPLGRASHIASTVILDAMARGEGVERAVFVLFREREYAVFLDAFNEVLSARFLVEG